MAKIHPNPNRCLIAPPDARSRLDTVACLIDVPKFLRVALRPALVCWALWFALNPANRAVAQGLNRVDLSANAVSPSVECNCKIHQTNDPQGISEFGWIPFEVKGQLYDLPVCPACRSGCEFLEDFCSAECLQEGRIGHYPLQMECGCPTFKTCYRSSIGNFGNDKREMSIGFHSREYPLDENITRHPFKPVLQSSWRGPGESVRHSRAPSAGKLCHLSLKIEEFGIEPGVGKYTSDFLAGAKTKFLRKGGRKLANDASCSKDYLVAQCNDLTVVVIIDPIAVVDPAIRRHYDLVLGAENDDDSSEFTLGPCRRRAQQEEYKRTEAFYLRAQDSETSWSIYSKAERTLILGSQKVFISWDLVSWTEIWAINPNQ